MGGGNTSAIRKCFQQHDFKFNLFLHSVSFRCEADGKWRAVDDFGLIPICLPGNIPLSALPLVLQELFSNDIVPSVCGKPRVDFSVTQRIIGGNDAPQGSIPWQVRISGGGGGMLIADRWVLTGALVLSPNMKPIPTNEVQMFWGTNNWTDLPVPNAIAASVHLHPGYNNPAHLNFDNDIALIKLPAPVTFNQFVMPICLPPENSTLQDGIVGSQNRGWCWQDPGYTLSKKLQYVHLPVVDPRACSKSLDIIRRTMSDVPEESHNMFCAGFPDGKKDSCQGDVGGPFALWSNDHYWAAGIMSWGVGCAEAGRYGFHTRVSNYVDWIHKTMKEN
uniref:trypsin n=1 Tax=Neogobius melanostomus TaxID=47308 RepID=A0A8C6WYA4_9GOBI